jgi:hypothetical protein
VLAGERAEVVLAYSQAWPAVRCQPRAIAVTYVCGFAPTATTPGGRLAAEGREDPHRRPDDRRRPLRAARGLVGPARPPPAAAAGVAADISAGVNGTYTGTNDLGTPSFRLQTRALNRLTEGTTSNKADKLFSDTRTISASSSENLDMAGTLTDPFGVTLTFATVKAIYVKASSANTNNVCVGGAASNGFLGPFSDATDIACVKPGGVLLITAPATGWTVTATTGDLLKVANSSSGSSVSYDVVIIGTSA